VGPVADPNAGCRSKLSVSDATFVSDQSGLSRDRGSPRRVRDLRLPAGGALGSRRAAKDVVRARTPTAGAAGPVRPPFSPVAYVLDGLNFCVRTPLPGRDVAPSPRRRALRARMQFPSRGSWGNFPRPRRSHVLYDMNSYLSNSKLFRSRSSSCRRGARPNFYTRI